MHSFVTQLFSRNASRGSPSSGPAGELIGISIVLLALLILFSSLSDRFFTGATFSSIAFQLPELGLLALAMLIPLLSGGLNLAITFSANISALAMAWVIGWLGGTDAGMTGILLGMLAAILSGALIGWALGAIVAYTGAHPILASLAMMIFLRGLGEFLTRGGSISGFPEELAYLGQGTLFGIPIPLLIFGLSAAIWALILNRTRLGFSIYMLGSNTAATRYSGISTRRTLTMVYVLSGIMCGIAGIIMASRFNSVRVGHGEAYLLITVLACFLGRVDPFGGFGRVAPVVMALIILQVISSGLNLLGTNQHLATALWGGILLAVMVVRYLWARFSSRRKANA